MNKQINLHKQIKELFSTTKKLAVHSQQVAQRLGIKNENDFQIVRKILHELVDKNYLSHNKREGYKLFPKSSGLFGKITINRNRDAIVILENQMEIKVSENNLFTAFNGDTVEIAFLAGKKNKNGNENIYGEVIKIISRAHTEFVGTLEKSKSYYFVIPDDAKIPRDIYIPFDDLNGAKSGDKVIAKLIAWDNPNLNPEGTIIDLLGRAGEVSAEIKSVIAEFRLATVFPKNVIDETEKIPTTISDDEISNRLDLRNLEILTIDPVDAKDFDDALSLEIIDPHTYRLGVHIADVSHYVKENSAIDIEAQSRGTSVYLANHVVPMLPEKLSNNLCSLKPKVDRFAFSCLIMISNLGVVKSFEFARSVIHSKKRFSYEEVENILEKKSGAHHQTLEKLWALAEKLISLRLKNGSIDFESAEAKFTYDETGLPNSVKVKERLRSHQLVEECMLLANKLVSKYISDMKSDKTVAPSIYRVHDLPDDKKITELAQFVKKFGYTLNISGGVTSKSIQKLLAQIKGSPEEYLINKVALRSMAKAIYSSHNTGHFGLGFNHYSHFTSPIRRYPDLLLHRLLDEYQNGMSTKRQQFFVTEIPRIAKHASDREKVAVNAERESIKVMQSEYMKRHIGEEFQGIISGVVQYGIFVEIFDILIEGMIPVRTMKDDYYLFDEKTYSLIGQQTNKILRLGDEVTVSVEKVNVERKQVDLKLIEHRVEIKKKNKK